MKKEKDGKKAEGQHQARREKKKAKKLPGKCQDQRVSEPRGENAFGDAVRSNGRKRGFDNTKSFDVSSDTRGEKTVGGVIGDMLTQARQQVADIDEELQSMNLAFERMRTALEQRKANSQKLVDDLIRRQAQYEEIKARKYQEEP